MNKLATLIAAVHASVLASSALTGPAMAQDSAEIKAYTNAVKTGTPAAIASFMKSYPKSTLPAASSAPRSPARSASRTRARSLATGGTARLRHDPPTAAGPGPIADERRLY
jgi:hypothetical protein